MGLIVQKFGGTSVANAERIQNVARIITDTYRQGNSVVAVLSAQGDTTDENNDNMTVEVELEQLFTDDYQRLTALQKSITRALKDEILLTPIVKLVPKGTLPVSVRNSTASASRLRNAVSTTTAYMSLLTSR